IDRLAHDGCNRYAPFACCLHDLLVTLVVDRDLRMVLMRHAHTVACPVCGALRFGACNALPVSGHIVGVERRLRFELLYAKHAPAVKAYVLRRADVSTADDVLAEVFVVCWRRFDEVPADPLPWLLGVARRVLSTQRRGERRPGALRDRLAETASDSTDAIPEVGDGTLAGVADGAFAYVGDGALAGALARLSEADRELLLLIAWDELSPSQAAT